MSRLVTIAKTIPKLGLHNVARVTLYKLRIKAGWRPRPLERRYPGGPVFGIQPQRQTDHIAPSKLSIFGWHPVNFAGPPDWHADPLGETPRLNPDQDWVHALAAVGDDDVKPYWELSRLYWLPQFALAAREGDQEAFSRMEDWLQDWIVSNQPFRGINWACGQEAAIRVMNLALSALILDTWKNPSPAMKWLIETHIRRIRPTLSYALGQDNNHGTAEACALFIAGNWAQRWSMPSASRLTKTGQKWLNDRALRLIQPDGSPCQYSTTYHRANLESFCMAGLWSARTGTSALHDDAADRIIEGARWLYEITDPTTGDAPNLGSNDGSQLFSVPQTPYRDFRPTVALAAALFANSRPWPHRVDARLDAFGLAPLNTNWPAATSRTSDDGGFHILRQGNSLALMHYPRFRFRPCQADLLHVDVWAGSDNVMRDDGSFSYAANDIKKFGSCMTHNTIQFDNADQMSRLGKFLYGDWREAIGVRPIRHTRDIVTAGAGYRTQQGVEHRRQIVLREKRLTCTDCVTGPFQLAVLRWRLKPGRYRIEGNSVVGPDMKVTFFSDEIPFTLKLTFGKESRFYKQSTSIPIIEALIPKSGSIVSDIWF